MGWLNTIHAAIGVFAFLISIYNLWRARVTAGEVRALACAQRKQELIAAILNAEAAYLAAQVQAQDLRDDAIDTKVVDAQSAIEQANYLIAECESALKLLEESRGALASAPSIGKTHKELVAFIEHHATAVSEFTNKNKIDAQAAAVLQPSRRLLRLIQAAKAAAAKPPGAAA